MTITSQDIQRYVRIGLQWAAGALVTHGTISPNASWVEPFIGMAVTLASFAWTLYGNRIQAKIDELQKIAVNANSPEDHATDAKVAIVNAAASISAKVVAPDLADNPATANNVVKK